MCIATSHRRFTSVPSISLHHDAKHVVTKSSPISRPVVTPRTNEQAVEGDPLPKRLSQHLIVHHEYKDHSHEIPPMDLEGHYSSTETAPFPIKLHDMLNRVQVEQQQQEQKLGEGGCHSNNIISWQPHGRCFIIHNPKDLVEQLLPRFFAKITKLASFQRQLNLYGFKRITQGLDKGAYYNEYFLRGKLFLAHCIQRICVKGTGVRAKSNPEEEPNLWDMEWVGVPPSVPTTPLNPTAAALNKAMAAFASGAIPSFLIEGSTKSSTISDYSMSSSSSSTPRFSAATTSLPLSRTPNLPLQKQQEEETSGDDLLNQWGQSFYALDDLPADLSEVHQSSSPSIELPQMKHSYHEEDKGSQVFGKMLLVDPVLTAMLNKMECDQDEAQINKEQPSQQEQDITPNDYYPDYHHYNHQDDSLWIDVFDSVADWSNESCETLLL